MDKKTTLFEVSIEALINDVSIDIPRYQRKFVWDLEKQRELIDSIKRDFPIGVLTTYESNGKKFILDGLQRLSTITRFINKPHEIFTWKTLKSYGLLDKFENNILSMNMSRTKNDKLVSSFKFIFENGMIQHYTKLSKFLAFVSEYSKIEYLIEEVEDPFRTFHDIFDISKYRMAVILYKGDQDNLADLFEKMNTGSILLSKYEIYAASWINYVFYEENLSRNLIDYSKLNYKIISGKLKDLSVVQEYQDFNVAEILIGYGYKYLNEIRYKDINEIIPKVKIENIDGVKYFSRTDIFHQIIASIIERKPTAINSFILKCDSILSINGETEEKMKFISFLDKICSISIELFPIVANYISSISFGENKLDYLYFYINSVVIYINYHISHDLKIERRNISEIRKDELLKEVIDKNIIIEEEWFKNKNRQVSFISDKIRYAFDMIDKNDY